MPTTFTIRAEVLAGDGGYLVRTLVQGEVLCTHGPMPTTETAAKVAEEQIAIARRVLLDHKAALIRQITEFAR